jgi:Fe2+ or Zn2+ uptake regulation protein
MELFMKEEPSTLTERMSPVEFANTKDIILTLKAVKEKNCLSISDIMKKLEDADQPISESTVRRVFRENSENDGGFVYDRSIKPIADVLLDETNETVEDTALLEKNEALHAIIKEKNRIIENLHEKIDILSEQNESLKKQYDDLRKECDLRLRFLRDQIEKKDARMDQKDAIIQRLMDKCL